MDSISSLVKKCNSHDEVLHIPILRMQYTSKCFSWMQQSGEGALCLLELWRVILPANPPSGSVSLMECVEALPLPSCPGTSSLLCPEPSMVRIPPTPGQGDQVQQRHGNLLWHMGKLRPQRLNDPWKPGYLA